MQHTGGWRVHTRMLACLSLVCIGILGGCQSAKEDKPAPAAAAPSPEALTPAEVVGIALTAGATSLVADGASSTTITAALVNSLTQPSPDGTVVNLNTDRGFFSTDTTLTVADRRKAAAVSSGGKAIVPFFSERDVSGTATLVATAKGVSQSLQITLTAPPAPAPPVVEVVGITLTAGSTSLVANGTTSTTISAALVNSINKPSPDSIVVTFTTDLGRFTPDGAKSATATTSQGTGMAVVPFISEQGVGGTATIVATVKGVAQSLQIALVAPPSPQPPAPPVVDVAGITLTAGTTSLVANGTTSTTITAALINSLNKPSPDGIVVNFTTDRGFFSTDTALPLAARRRAAATTSGGTGLVPFISEPGMVGTATVVAGVKGVAQSLQITLTGAGPPARIILTPDATSISIGGTVAIKAQVLDAEGNNVTDGRAVNFTTSLAGTGVTPTTTTINGETTAVFSAGTKAGVASVTAASDAATATVSITIQPGNAGSLEFVSAEPTVIGVRGSALPQKATLTFRARDVNGNPVADGTLVMFTLISGLGGGETITPTVAGTVAGLAATILTGGTVAGPVRVLTTVTVGTTILSSSSTNVSIAGGAPSGAHFGVAHQVLNMAGQVFQGIICSVTALVGDRFGNPVPQGTAVSFFTNGGVISAQGLTDALGNARAGGLGGGIKTGEPIPHVGTVVDPTDPRTGFVDIIAITQGEETFIDSNGNGVFDGPQEFNPSDPLLDTPEPFIDNVTDCTEFLPDGTSRVCLIPANPTLFRVVAGNNQFDLTDRFELFIDPNGNGVWDRPNGIWDSNKPIFTNPRVKFSGRVLFSGHTVLRVTRLQTDGSCQGSPSGFRVPNGGSVPFCILVSDPGGHPLVGGSKITVATTAGAIAGTASFTMPDTQLSGPGITFFTFTVGDSDATKDESKAASVTVSVTSPETLICPGGNGNAEFSFDGTVDAQ